MLSTKYLGLIVGDPNPPPSERAMSWLEAELRTSLPEDYLAFVQTCNGGYVDYDIEVVFADGSSEALCFCSFYEVVQGSAWETVPFELINAKKMEGFPQERVLPIARDGSGSQLFLDLRDGYGVAAFVHGLPAWTGLREEDSLVRVADSFAEYWSRLAITDDYAQYCIEDFDPKYFNAESLAEWLDTGNKNWRTKFGDLWNKHVANSSQKIDE